MTAETAPETETKPPGKRPLWQKLVPWLITIACFAWMYRKMAARAGDEGVASYIGGIFASVDWVVWLAWMVPYSIFYLAIDTLILWRVVNWFNAKIPYLGLLPIRASSYIISLLNEQVGKGAIAVYLNRTRDVPGWQVGSSMIFIMFCEAFYLIGWGFIGWTFAKDILPDELDAIRWAAVAAMVVLGGVLFFFRSQRFEGVALRDRHIFHAFRQAGLSRYLTIVLFRSPALLSAVWVYSECAALFGVDIPLLDMLGFLPLIFCATLVPGPFRAVAISLWAVLFPEQDPAKMFAFGFVQHNFFLVFNAAIGLLFVRKANRELIGDEAPPAGA
jgi:hypothetical protein